MSAATAAYAETAADLQPTGPWRVDYGETECRLLRTFGPPDRSVILRVARGNGLDRFDMVLAGTGIPRLRQQIDVTLRLEPQALEQQVSAYSMALPDTSGRFVRWYDADSELIEAMNRDQRLVVTSNGGLAVTLNMLGAKAAIAALDVCYADLLKSWGLDLAKEAQVAVRPKAIGGGGGTVTALRSGARPSGPAGWATWADYPTEALRQEIGGTVVMSLLLDLRGRVADCRVVVSTKFAPLDEKSCLLMRQRAQYTPALDAKGNALAATVIQRIRWIIPEG